MAYGGEPTILYDSALEDGTLSVFSGGATLSTGALTNLTDRLLFNTATFASFSGSSLTLDCDLGGVSDDFDRSDEAPLSTNWTKRHTDDIDLSSNVATNSGQTSISDYERQFTHDTDKLSNGNGVVKCDVKFANTTAGTTIGIMGRWQAGPSNANSFVYTALAMSPGGAVLSIGVERDGIASVSSTIASVTDTSGAWYTLTLTLDGETISSRVEKSTGGAVDETISVTFAGSYWGSNAAGIVSVADQPGTTVADWNDWSATGAQPCTAFAMSGQVFQGATGANTGGRYSLSVEYSDDNSSFTAPSLYGWGSTTPVIGTDRTLLLAWDHATAHRYWRFVFTDLSLGPSGDVTIGALALGQRLDFTEYMGSGFDPHKRKTDLEQNRGRDGGALGSSVGSVRQRVDFRFGAPIARAFVEDPDTDFGSHDVLPSWQDFQRTTETMGKPYWIAWTLPSSQSIRHRHSHQWFGFPTERGQHSAPFISGTHRNLRHSADVLVEGMKGAAP